MFGLAIDGELRGRDLVGPRIGQPVVNASARHRATTIQQKTGQPARFEPTGQTRGSLLAWPDRRGGALEDHVSPSRAHEDKHLSTRQYARLVGEWAEAAGLGRSAHGTHSPRRTKVAPLHQRTGDLRAVRIPLGHAELESTARRLGVDAGDAPTLPEAAEV